jgi:hypothetical protein
MEVGNDFRLIPAGTVIFDAGHAVIKTLEETVIVPLLLKERVDEKASNKLGHVLCGKFEVIVDAILHTSKGAVGESVERVVEIAALKTAENLPFEELEKAPAERVELVRSRMEDVIPDLHGKLKSKDLKIDFGDWKESKKGCILYSPFGDEEEKGFLLVIDGKETVIIDGSNVRVINKKEYVAITDKGVFITKRSGKRVTINSAFPGKILNKVFTGLGKGFARGFDFDFDCSDFDFDLNMD